jgi:hypothetical protein
MVQDAQGPDEWILLSTCVARMSELHPVYSSYLGFARRDLETAIKASRAVLRGRRPGLADRPPAVIDGPITARHRLDLIHNTLSERTPGPSGDNVLFRDVEIEWNKSKDYLRAHAAECWPTDDKDVKTPNPQARAHTLPAGQVRKFAADYIKQEKNAGRAPKLAGLEKAARDRGYKSRRDALRQAFRDIQNDAGTPVRRGRPKKSPS